MTSQPTLTVRRASASDASVLAELGTSTFREAFAADNRPEDMAAYLASAFSPAQIKSELLDLRSTFLVAYMDGAPAGYAKLYAGRAPDSVMGTNPIELARIYASHNFLGRGVGSTLMRACLDEARGRGHQTVWLGVWERNARAIAFYRKWGFREVGTQIFQLGSDPQTDVVMEREL